MYTNIDVRCFQDYRASLSVELKKEKTETGLGSKKENSSVDTEREKFTGGIEVLKK